MRRILSILDVLRKVRPKPMADATSSSKSGSDCEGSGTPTSKQRINFNKKDNAGGKSSGPGNEVLWRNLRHVLNICEGQQKPPTIASRESDVEFGALVNVLEVQRFVSDVFAAMNVPLQAASEMADALIAADYMGQRSMGIHRLPSIASDLLNLRVDARMQPKVLCEREALALVDGQNAPGPVVANFSMDLAMLKARDQGIGFVAARRSNNIGMASWYACQALAQRMIGLCLSNGLPILVPSGGIEPLLGDNCIACAAASTQEQFLVDIGMSAYPIQQLELDYCNGYLQELPPQLALDCNGHPTTSTAAALRAQRLHPFTPEHKGFGVAAMVDILCGVMTGARYASQLGRRGLFSLDQDMADLGQVYIAIDPMRFCVSFEERLADFHQLLRNVLPCNPNQPPLIPGDKENQHMQMVDDQGGLILSPCTLYVLQELSERFNINPIKSNKKA
ncbi:2,3-diketo-L-gulonate reductase [Drosophila innubila]|uniref:2,3-diketo-L-gulonate reductase n=1 Tax=Drosophila innubila TaxID=198719 RepID=UPI00148D58E9|nr:2,3-diketo-L-gulonate reductase [Drosophila innubila]